jgi:enoyl-CoA hydratase/carnithine racemase
MSSLVSVSLLDGVANVRLNRPDKRNALSDELFAALFEVVTELPTTSGLRAVVLSGNGPVFCAGLDLGSLTQFASSPDPENRSDPVAWAERAGGRAQGIVKGLVNMPVPVIAAIHGAAVGAGFQIALGADIRIVAPDTKFSIREIEYGITPDMGGTQLLPRLVGYERALELIVSGRFISGEEAFDIGLVSRVSADPLSEALALARLVASKSPTAIRLDKQLVQSAFTLGIEDGYAAELNALAQNFGSANQLEAVKAHFEKREPSFVDPVA